MKILHYIANMFLLSIIYFILFTLIYYFSVKYELISKHYTDLLHSYKYASSISFIFIIFLPIIIIPNINLWLSKLYDNKMINKKLLFINVLIIIPIPIIILKYIGIALYDPILINILFTQIISIIISFLIYTYNLKKIKIL